MPRPRKCRFIERHPEVTYFKPQGVPLKDLEEERLSIEGFEALRLVDQLGHTMEEAGERMGVSRHILSRVIAKARRVVASALVNGSTLRIEGGSFEIKKDEQAKTPEYFQKEQGMTIVAVSSEGPELTDMVDPRFGRAGGFVVVDTETMQTRYLDNGACQALAHGAGIQTTQAIADMGATVVLTGFVGPKAWQALEAAKVRVGQDLENMTVGEAVKRFVDGKVVIADKPNR